LVFFELKPIVVGRRSLERAGKQCDSTHYFLRPY